MSNNTQNEQLATMNEVVMPKDKLLEALIANKAKHDVVLATAISGYWDIAQQKIEDKRKALMNLVADFHSTVTHELDSISKKITNKETLPSHISIKALSVDPTLNLVYPQDHSKDYDRAIHMMNSSVYDKVKLSVTEYDAYVLNNWEWKQNFLASNSAYVTAYKNKSSNSNFLMASGCLVGLEGPSGPVGRAGESWTSTYEKASKEASEELYKDINKF